MAIQDITIDVEEQAGIEMPIGDGQNVISTGIAGWLRVPFDCEIQNVELTSDASGSIVVDIWKDTYGNYPPTDADSITASAVPTISSATKSQDNTLTGWTKSLSEGDYLYFNVDSITTIKGCLISIQVRKSQPA